MWKAIRPPSCKSGIDRMANRETRAKRHRTRKLASGCGARQGPKEREAMWKAIRPPSCKSGIDRMANRETRAKRHRTRKLASGCGARQVQTVN